MDSRIFAAPAALTGVLVLLSSLAVSTLQAADGATRVDNFNTRRIDADDDGQATSVRRRLLDIAERERIPDAVMDALLRGYGYDLDLDQPALAGDSIKVLYGRRGAEQDVLLAAAFSFGGQAHTLYRFVTEDGADDYYDAAGRSWHTRLLRKPMTGGTLSSGFGMHRHPLLGYSRMHTGVDWSANLGTPVYAAGDGEVVTAAWSGGDGNTVRLANGVGYVTGYAHLQDIAAGLYSGVHVEQGQVIGVVGSTGVASGPHLHYEVLIADRYVDPLRVKLPALRTLDGDALAAFTRERDRLDEGLRQLPANALTP
jgi:murein DD-endopeptidase MepM/ murein hydrolase activator NlpD